MNKNKTLPKAWEEIDKHAQSFLSKEGGEIRGSLGLPNGSITARSIELKYSTPFIDFHFGRSDSDYTSRIIENESGVLTVSGKLTVNSGITGSLIGNSTTATRLQTARSLFGNTFDGSSDVAGKALVYGTYTPTPGHRYMNSALEIRESGLIGASQTDIGYAPSLGFHWGGRVAATLAMSSGGEFQFINQTGTGYSNVIAGNVLVGSAQSSSANALTRKDYVDGALSRKLNTSGGTISGNLTVTGAIVANGNVTAYSDRKLKSNIFRIENALDKICSIGGYTFDMLGTGQRQTGVIAQELEKVLPEAVIKNDNGYLSVDYGRVVGLLIEGIKELKEEIQELKGGK